MNDWTTYTKRCCYTPALDVIVDASRVPLDDAFLAEMRPAADKALASMNALEGGAIANPDEQRMVGHYWLRAPELAPKPELTETVRETIAAVKQFAAEVHDGTVHPQITDMFTDVLLVGIGGSALGPQLVADALTSPDDAMNLHFFDNTDPDGMDRVLAELGDALASTLMVVISKSGGTVETRNGMLEAEAAYRRAGLDAGAHAVAVTGAGSKLAAHAEESSYLRTFPMWDWVGGRTSVTSAVGLLPAALQGLDIDGLLAGAAAMDAATREAEPLANPATLLALSWYREGGGRGDRAMVMLPYKDRLGLMGKYLQQLVMESIGKELDRNGATVEQGLAVYGNKGSTDQHAYVQQLRDGRHDFFVTFLDVLADRDGASVEVEPDVTAGDYLAGFLLGTRLALQEKGRASITVTLPDISARSLGALIALYERAVGLYAELIDINAYHQPGVEAGKRAAAGVIGLQKELLAALRARAGERLGVPELAAAVDATDRIDTVHTVLMHLAASAHHPVTRDGADPFGATFGLE